MQLGTLEKLAVLMEDTAESPADPSILPSMQKAAAVITAATDAEMKQVAGGPFIVNE
jgi:hypothetical protein